MGHNRIRVNKNNNKNRRPLGWAYKRVREARSKTITPQSARDRPPRNSTLLIPVSYTHLTLPTIYSV